MTWTFEQYWNVVLGANRNAGVVVREFDLRPGRRGLDEWLGDAESAAWSQGALGGDLPEEWGTYHVRALDALEVAASEPEAQANRDAYAGREVAS